MEEEHKRINHTIIQISSVTSEKEPESDHCVGVRAGERDRFYRDKLCVNRGYSVVESFAWQSCLAATARG